MATHDVPRAARPRTEEERQQELVKIDKYRTLEDQFRQQATSTKASSDTLQLTTKLLRLNPEYYTVWNARRRCLVSGPLSKPALPEPLASPQAGGAAQEVIRAELDFVVPLLLQHPKCYWIWNYRMWILQQAIEKLGLSAARAIWEEELALVGKMLHRDSRNFHAWAYRRYVVGQLESPCLDGRSMLEGEFQYTTRMIHKDLSNFSAWHNRSQLVGRLLDERSATDAVRAEFLDQEFEFVRRGLDVGPEDQSLWYYHQFLVSNVAERGQRPSIVPHLSLLEREAVVGREIDAIKELLEDYDDIKWIYEVLLEYTFAARRLKTQTGEVRASDEAGVAQWLSKLRELDPMRGGRWDDLAKDLGLV